MSHSATIYIGHLSRHTWSVPRRFVLAIGASLAAVVWVHALAALLRSFDAAAPIAAAPLTLASVLVASAGVFLLPRRFAALMGGAVGLLAAGVLAALVPGSFMPALALPMLGFALTAAARRIGERLPSSVDRGILEAGTEKKTVTKALAMLWVVLSLVSVVQMGRLATHVADRAIPFKLVTENPFWYGHECLPAYLHGAELALDGAANIYHAHHYPALDAAATPVTRLEMAVEDPYQYPPQFLLLPTLALKLTQDVGLLRITWFALQVSLFGAAFAALALWIGGRSGRTALWLLPTTVMAWPMLFNFQFGQFHLPALALAVLGMLAFVRGRTATGGFLLASSILAKIFPLVLLVPLIMKRRIQEVAWVILWGAAASALTLLIFGPAPYVAFFDYHLPRLGSGAAFAFDEAWPEVSGLVVADNQGVYGLARKFGAAKPAAAWASRLFGFVVLALAALWAWRERRISRWAYGTSWLALLGAASLASPGAWGDYVPTTALWLLALVAAKAIDEPRLRWPLGLTAILQFFVLGTMPIGEWAPYGLMVSVSGLGVISMLALFGYTLGLGLFSKRRLSNPSPRPDPTRDLRLAPDSVC